jgi:hypothetical protein
MNCPVCRAFNPPGSQMCAICRSPFGPAPGGPGMPHVQGMPYGQGMYYGPTKTSGLAIAGFVLSFFFGLLGLIFSILGLRECNRSGGRVGGRGLAIAGIVISSISLVIVLLAAISIPAFMKYIKMSKSSEARSELMMLRSRAEMFHAENGHYPPSTEFTPPLGTCCAGPNNRCQPDPAMWDNETWRALDFRMDTTHDYSYRFESSGNEFTITAQGDLDCDGAYSTWVMTSGSPEIARYQELE